MKLIYTEKDLEQRGLWVKYDVLRNQLHKAHEREECILIQGSAFVVKGKAFLILGVGGIDFLDSLGNLEEVDGILGNGNALFISNDFKNVYSAHTAKELINCFELENYDSKINFLEFAPIAPLIFLIRSFNRSDEYENAKKKTEKILFEVANTFCRPPIKYAGSLKSRLRAKFIATTRVVHCARRPTLDEKECLFDSENKIRQTIDIFKGDFALMYTLWNQQMCDAIGMSETRKLSESYNPTDPITPKLVQLANQYL